MVTEKVAQLTERYPKLEKVIQIAAQYEDSPHHPMYQICEFLIELVDDFIPISDVPLVNDSEG